MNPMQENRPMSAYEASEMHRQNLALVLGFDQESTEWPTLLDAVRDLKPEAPKAQTDMQVQVTRHRYANMGDHAEYVTEAVKYDPTETVEAMVLRVLRLREAYMRHDAGDTITLQVVEGTEPDNTPRDSRGVAQPPL